MRAYTANATHRAAYSRPLLKYVPDKSVINVNAKHFGGDYPSAIKPPH